MKKTYFKPQFKVVKFHGSIQLLGASQTTQKVSISHTNLEGDDNIIYGGSSENDEGDGFAR